MQEYLLLYKSPSNKYYPMKNNMKSGLWDLNEYFLSDYKYYDYYQDFFDQEQIHGQETIVINDKQHKNFYILIIEHNIEEHIPDDNRLALTNEANSCKISYDNFIEFRQQWVQLQQDLLPFALIYRDDNDWIACKGFVTQEEMELFVGDAQMNIIH